MPSWNSHNWETKMSHCKETGKLCLRWSWEKTKPERANCSRFQEKQHQKLWSRWTMNSSSTMLASERQGGWFRVGFPHAVSGPPSSGRLGCIADRQMVWSQSASCCGWSGWRIGRRPFHTPGKHTVFHLKEEIHIENAYEEFNKSGKLSLDWMVNTRNSIWNNLITCQRFVYWCKSKLNFSVWTFFSHSIAFKCLFILGSLNNKVSQSTFEEKNDSSCVVLQ